MKTLITLLTIFILSLFISNEPERCEHILIKGDAVGITQTWITVCNTHRMQVDNFGTHKQTERSTKYFE